MCLVEQGNVGIGVTSKTTGKINFIQETIYSDLEKKYSFKVAKKYYQSQRFVIKEFERIINDENIQCNLEKVKAYVYTNNDKNIESIKREKNILEEFGNEVEKTWDCPCHASRFDLDGKCIKGPSVYDISYKEES